MISRETRRAMRHELMLSALLVALGIVVIGLSMIDLSAQRDYRMAQTTQPSQDSPTIPAGKDNGPAESKPGGTRPTTPGPEPARPEAEAQRAGAKPALPPAPAEKIGEPIQK